MASAKDLEKSLKAAANPAQAADLSRFFKTGPGEYGEGDRFLGIKVPVQRQIAKQYRDLPLAELEKALQSPWHECRLTALIILVHQYSHGDESIRRKIHASYLKHRKHLNNWDLIDTSAGIIVGAHLMGSDCALLYKLAKSPKWNERRIAVIATSYFIVRGEFEVMLKLAEMLLEDEHDLLHKATGWMLREIGKRDERVLRTFLNRHAPSMPRMMLRYAIEKLSAAKRSAYLQLPRTVKRS